VNFARIARRVWRQWHELIITRPKGKLVLHVLRLGNVNRRMTRLLGPLFRQVKCKLGGAIAIGRDQKDRLPGSCFEFATHLRDRGGGGAPTAESIGRVAVAAPDSSI